MMLKDNFQLEGAPTESTFSAEEGYGRVYIMQHPTNEKGNQLVWIYFHWIIYLLRYYNAIRINNVQWK